MVRLGIKRALPLAERRVPDGPYLVLGLGQAGVGAAEALVREGKADQVVAFDHLSASVPKRVRRALASQGVDVRIGDEAQLADCPAPRTVVRSPGLPLDLPLIEKARRRGAEVIDELELGWRLSRAPVIAITGTNGKTTTGALSSALLEAAGLSAPLAGNADIAPPLSAIRGDPDAIVCEASSFQIEGCPLLLPEVGLFTNLTRDHLGRHGTMDRYFEIKRSLFLKDGTPVPLAVIDVIDEPGSRLADEVEGAGGRVVRLGQDNRAPYRLLDAGWDLHHSQLELQTPAGIQSLRTNLPGIYNARNAALAVALADELGLPRELTVQTLAAHPGARGRFEHVGRVEGGAGAQMILDTASSPDAVRQILTAIRTGMPAGAHLYAVLGVLGAAESAQRREVGRVAASLCDRLVLTAGSYRRNPPVSTMEEMLAGAREVVDADLAVIPHREAAIGTAAAEASKRDVICVIGRGNVRESISDRKFDDRGAMARLTESGGDLRSGPERLPKAASRQLAV